MSSSTLAVSFDGSTKNGDVPPTPSKKSKPFSGFDFYRRKLFSSSSSPPSTPPLSSSPPSSTNHLVLDSKNGRIDTILDPTKGFHPLISMYYLAREKMEREKVFGVGIFASSKVEINEERQRAVGLAMGHTSEEGIATSSSPTVAIPSAAAPYSQGKREQLSAPLPTQSAVQPSMPTPPSPAVGAKADYSMPLPRLPAPETSHYSGMSYDAAAAPTTPTTPGFVQQQKGPQPRARDAGNVLPTPVPATAPLPSTSGGIGKMEAQLIQSMQQQSACIQLQPHEESCHLRRASQHGPRALCEHAQATTMRGVSDI
ncbi:hypothetical protein MPER_01387 [Moniliophthora perniciosa FA553]|nr:hypothetical protein MPER_01387 [Moniliophthora perniciosa FA553]